MDTDTAEGRPRDLVPVALIFFVSGFPALLYQLVWQRSLFLVFGVNVESVAVVVTAFMLGLGFGSLLGGALTRIDRLRPLLAFAAIEIGIAALALVSLPVLAAVGDAVLDDSLLATSLYALGLLLAPTVLMGASLPLLAGFFAARSRNVGRSLGMLYYANTAGAAVACFAAATLLFPHLGMQGTVWLGAAINGLAGLAALAVFLVSRQARASVGGSGAGGPAAVAPAAPPLRFGLAMGLVFLSGFIALSYEVFWFRVVDFATGSRAAAFALTLGAVLAGIAGGAGVAWRHCHARAGQARRLLVAVPVCALAASLLSYLMIPLTGALATLGPVLWLAALLPMIILASGLWGALLPLLGHLGVAPDRRAGLRLGILYAANIVGSASGSLVTGFGLMQMVGLQQVSLGLFLGGLGFAALLLPVGGLSPRRRGGAAALLVLVAGLGWAGAGPLFERVHHRLLFKDRAAARAPLAEVVENRHGIVAITRDGTVFGNGMYDGALSVDLHDDRNGIVRPYSLSLWHPAPRRVLMIGLATGAWAKVVANHPQLERLTVVEINAGYLDIIRRHPKVADLLDHPRVEVVIDDGRRWLRRHPDRRFDAVVMNTTFNFRAHTTNLLSEEFLRIVRDHLRPDGVLLYNTTSSRRVQRTGCAVFGHGYRFLNQLVVSPRPLRPDTGRWARQLRAYRLDGGPVFDPDSAADRALLDRLLALPGNPVATEPCADLLQATAGLETVTDDNMGTEWRADPRSSPPWKSLLE